MPIRVHHATLLAFVVFLVVALVATFPLVRRPSHTVAGGLGDPIIVTTVLAWDADRIAHGFAHFWDAPFLYPHRHALAYSEHMLGVAIFTTPLEWLLHEPVLVYNIAYIGSYVLAGFGMFLLARSLWGRTDAALLAGLAFALTPYRLAQSSHLQVLMSGWMAVGLWALHRHLATGSRRWMAAFAGAYLLAGLSNGYYLYFFLLPVATVVVVEFVRPRLPRKRVVIDLAAAGAAIAVALLPIVLVYFRLQREHGFVRPAEELPGLSARAGDYFRISPGVWSWGGLLQQGDGERQLFQGFVVLILAAIGVWTLRRRDLTGASRDDWNRSVVTYAIIAVLAVWLSMGPGPWRPYGLLFHVVPGLNGLRVPARLGAVVGLAWSVLAGAGLAWCLQRLPKGAALTVAAALAVLIALEGQHGVGASEVEGWRDKSWDRVAYEWLRDSPPGAVLELNITEMDDFHPFTTIYQLNTLDHRHPIVNGYMGWKSNLQELLGARDSPLRDPEHTGQTLIGLRRIGVRYVLLHESTFATPDAAEHLTSQIQAEAGQIREAHRWPGVWAWRLNDVAPLPKAPAGLSLVAPTGLRLHASHQENRLPLMFDGNLDSRWMTGDRQAGNEWIEIRLPQPIQIGRLQIVGAGRTLPDYPRRLKIDSTDGDGVSHTLFDDGVADLYVESVAFDDLHPSIAVDLPANRTTTLRISQVGHGSAWWSIHELRIWELRPPSPPVSAGKESSGVDRYLLRARIMR